MRRPVTVFGVLFFTLIFSGHAFSHCEVPCGIYDDGARIAEIREHIATIEKAMIQVQELSGEEKENYNQIVRWISNKEKHAEGIQHIVHQYFMTQRIKPKDASEKEAYAKYIKELTLLHEMLVYAMKSKQTLDTANPKKLREALDAFVKSYLGDA